MSAEDTAPEETPSSVAPPRARIALLCAVAIVVLVADQGTKALALARLEPGERVPVLGDLLGWRLVFNPGAAFSFGTGVTWVFTVVMAVVAGAVLLHARNVRVGVWAVAFGALLGGALGNLVDRLAREPGFGIGHVVDFIDYGVFIGNVADIAIVAAALGMVLLSVLGSSWDRPRGAKAAESEIEAEPEPAPEPAPAAEPESERTAE